MSSPVEIPLHRFGEVVAYAVVDAEDFARFGQHRWRLDAYGYAVRTVEIDLKSVTLYLHREILGLKKGDGFEGDHRDRNPLNCRRSNLRVATHQQNQQNKLHRHGTSRYRGVYWDKQWEKWTAQATLNGRGYRLGRFESEEEAARVAAEFRARHMPFSAEAAAA